MSSWTCCTMDQSRPTYLRPLLQQMPWHLFPQALCATSHNAYFPWRIHGSQWPKHALSVQQFFNPGDRGEAHRAEPTDCVLKGAWKGFTAFLHGINSYSTENWFYNNHCPVYHIHGVYHIATNFCACHDSAAVVEWAKVIKIWIKAKWNCFRIWFTLEISLEKRDQWRFT